MLIHSVTHSPLSYTQHGNRIYVENTKIIKKEFGLACKKNREAMGLSQEKFALKIGMDRTYFASVESGKRNVSIRNLKKIADGLGVSLSVLFENF